MKIVLVVCALLVMGVLVYGCAVATKSKGPGAALTAPAAGAGVQVPAPVAGKVTEITAEGAWHILQQDPRAVILDVRTQAEYVFVGHPAAAVNIPLQFWDAATNRWSDNTDFVARAQARLPMDGAVITMCRSGHRSKKAAELLVKLGYQRVYNMSESFEGDADPATGLRTVNGWKNRGLPYTFDVDRKLFYQP